MNLKKFRLKIDLRTLAWTIVFVGFTSASVATSGRGDFLWLGALLGLLLAGAWHLLVLHPMRIEETLGDERLELNLETQNLKRRQLGRRRLVFAAGLLALWSIAVLPPLAPQGRELLSWLEKTLRTEQVVLRIEYPSYLDTQARETRLKGNAGEEIEIDADAYVSVAIKYRKQSSQWAIAFRPSNRNSNIQPVAIPTSTQ
ncbi:hypothetical protein EBR21_17790, partial [bacterium]|nr:hypothetical protein [bacterium]